MLFCSLCDEKAFLLFDFDSKDVCTDCLKRLRVEVKGRAKVEAVRKRYYTIVFVKGPTDKLYLVISNTFVRATEFDYSGLKQLVRKSPYETVTKQAVKDLSFLVDIFDVKAIYLQSNGFVYKKNESLSTVSHIMGLLEQTL